MKFIYFGNNKTAWKVLEYLKYSGDEIVGLVIHPEDRRKFGDEIIEVAGLREDRIFEAQCLRNIETIECLRSLEPDIGLSVFFGYILKPELLNIFPEGCLNLHPALLPYNRGANPNVWSIVDGTPAGVTLHFVDEGIDTGDIVAQLEVPVELVDTGESVYRKLELACYELFRNSWPKFKLGECDRIPQSSEAGTFHRLKDLATLDEIDSEIRLRARDLVDILRARTFPPNKGAYIKFGTRKVFIELKLSEEVDE